MDRYLYASHTIWQLIFPKSIVHFSMTYDYRQHSSIVMCGYTPLTIRETETLVSNGLYI